jgi:hypothetical protein
MTKLFIGLIMIAVYLRKENGQKKIRRKAKKAEKEFIWTKKDTFGNNIICG